MSADPLDTVALLTEFRPGSRWWRRDPRKRTHKGVQSIWTLRGPAARAKTGLNGDQPALVLQSRYGTQTYINPDVFRRDYEEVPSDVG